jgi:choice-of-anchor B domain-containing protein
MSSIGARPPKRVFALSAAILAGLAAPAGAQFPSNNVSLYSANSWLDLSELGGADNGNDCWAYVSPSGREYALMVVSNALFVVEITNPASPQIVGSVAHTNSLWGDVKVYQTYCYVSNESGGGIDVVNLSQVDSGIVTYVTSVTAGGLATTHNVALNTDSGYLYLCGANLNGGRLRAYSLANPANPVFAGQVSDAGSVYCHDAEIVTYTSGPYAGREIAFCANGGTGLDVYDVTNKASMFRMSRSTYPNLAYCHQCWLSADRQYLYVDDELDGVNETVIFDVTDLSAPVLMNTYSSGIPATDHNVYVHNGYIFEADYRGGLRIFCLDDPVNPVQVGWFDSYPENDAAGYDGAWSICPFFPSGAVIISDINRGLFVVDPSEALSSGSLIFSYPASRPDLVDPQGGTSFQIQIDGTCGASADPDTALLHYDIGQGYQTVAASHLGGDLFEAAFPALRCGATVQYYLSAQDTGGATFTDPVGAPGGAYTAQVADGTVVLLQDDFETDQGWVATNLGATAGFWQRGVPVNDAGWAYDPATDGDGSGQAWLTQNELGNTDVDNGAVRLTSPLLDLSGGNVTISYEYFLRLTDSGTNDHLLVEISTNGGAGPWTTIADHNTDGGLAWHHHEITQAQLEALGVTPSATTQVRFTANDGEPQSINESGLDGFTIGQLQCGPAIPGDIDGDGIVGINDLLLLLSTWGPCADCGDCPADIDNDCLVGINDLLILLANWS